MSGEGACWWSEKFTDDLYIHANLARHLGKSGKVEELETLLVDYRWTMRQVEVNGRIPLESDFNKLLEYKERTQPQKNRRSIREILKKGLQWRRKDSWTKKVICVTDTGEIRLLLQALRMSWARASSSQKKVDVRQLSFQLLGRLVDSNKQMVRVQQYSDSVKK